jgi:hypothetical protein
MKTVKPRNIINSKLKSNPNDPFIQKKVQQATDILNSLKEPIKA